ncbi:hypothetical protein ABRY23_12930 [Melioribacteraceae bacterium 4301-Me]|uniref:hypothetical protein n=1 Tax=Pyranulibacter aquaticus TaxID=3163344 RepID=UPI00359992EF
MLKTTLFSFLMLLLFVSFSNAQMRRTPAERAKMLAERLKLNEEQTKKVESIYEKQQEKMSKLFNDNSGSRQEMREKFRQLADETNAEIEKILNKNQKEEFKKFIEEQRNRMYGRRQVQ